MKWLTGAWRRLPEYGELYDRVRAGKTPAACFGLPYCHRILLADVLAKELGRKAVLVVPSEAEAAKAAEDLRGLGRRVLLFPSRDFSPRAAVRSPEFEQERIGTLSLLGDGAFDLLILTPAALISRTLPPEQLKELRFTVAAGDTLEREDLLARLTAAGYVRTEKVESAGQFAVRGEITDIFSPDGAEPIRLDFWGDTVDSVARFDPDTQRRTESPDRVSIVPAREVPMSDPAALAETLAAQAGKARAAAKRERLFADADAVREGRAIAVDRYLDLLFSRPATVLDHLNDPLLFFCDTPRLDEAFGGIDALAKEEQKVLAEEGLTDRTTRPFFLPEKERNELFSLHALLYLESMPRGRYDLPPETVVSFTAKQVSPSATLHGLAEDIPADPAALTVIFAGEKRTAQSIASGLAENGITARFCEPDGIGEQGVYVTTGSLSAGMELPAARVTLIPYGRAVVPTKRRRLFKKGADIGSLDELHPGDAVVHSVYGIGRFDGICPITTKGITQDYIRIRYHGTDVLYVPVTSLDMVSRYIGADDNGELRLNRLGSPEWSRTRARVRAAVKDIAKQLTALYAKRMQVKGFAFRPDCDMQRDFEQRFPYEETGDQLRCAEEIKKDMESPVPMDRLLCGDVGFGKTEVALRAAFKCIADGKQCAILVPTTILAWQHYTTATERFTGLPVTVEMLSRFRTAAQQTKIKKRLAAGAIDLIVGTHRLISSDIRFKDLGLLIVDEEQRFGVAQKEKLKALFPTVDVLTLSATPIPRTLNMALSGLRDMSALEEAPHDRLPVQTYVMEQSVGVIDGAIAKELARGGQVYYLHNRTDSIAGVAARLSLRFPEARIGVAHGKMSEEELSTVWKQLLEHEIDLLVCTTIIETGVDVPNVNTLIIEDADRFGLAQLHQLRGRVGRSHRRAYAYFLFRPGKALSEISQKRLEAIREFTAFGSGYRIAMRDLELRGAGSVLGGEQHGHMEAVGYDMYLRLLNDAIAEEKGEEKIADRDCSIDLRSTARIPEAYITDLSQRLEMYRLIAAIRTEEERMDVTDELIDRFGEPPKPVLELMDVALLKARCIALGFTDVSERNGQLILCRSSLEPDMVLALYGAYGNRLTTAAGETARLSVKLLPGENAFSLLASLLAAVEAFRQKEPDPGENPQTS